MNDPTRLLDDPDTGELMRSALEAGRAELPSEAQLDSLAAKLGPLLFPGGGPGPGPGPGAGTVAAIGAAILAAAVAGTLLLTPDDTTSTPEPAVEDVAMPEEPPEPIPIPTGVDMPETLPEVVDETPAPRPRPAAPAYETDLAAELALIRRAQNALRATPSEAMTLVREHQRRFGPGTLAQEREVVAVDALAQLGRRADAEERGRRFRERWPGSAHRRRIDVILGGGAQ